MRNQGVPTMLSPTGWLARCSCSRRPVGGRPNHFERLKTDKKQMKNLPYIQKNNIFCATWGACYVSWNHKKNNVANTMAQVEFLRQKGKKARTKFSVYWILFRCTCVVSRAIEGTPHVGSGMRGDQEPLHQGFEDHHGTGRLQQWKVWVPSHPQTPQTTKIPFSLQVHALGGRLGTDSMSPGGTLHKIKQKKANFWKLFKAFVEVIQLCGALLELPTGWAYWNDNRMRNLMSGTHCKHFHAHGCTYGVVEQYGRGRAIKTPWSFLSWKLGKPKNLELKCDGSHKHAPCAGRETKGLSAVGS